MYCMFYTGKQSIMCGLGFNSMFHIYFFLIWRKWMEIENVWLYLNRM